MDEFHQREGEGLIAFAIRMRNLPADHPARVSASDYDRLMRAAIAQVERQQAANREVLRKAGLTHVRI